MSFFLLGRGPEGDLVLLSDSQHATRQEALSELSRVTSDPSFAHWDAEVFVVDLEAATPVLLVRPAATETVPVSTPTDEMAAEPEAGSVEPLEIEAEAAQSTEPEAEAADTVEAEEEITQPAEEPAVVEIEQPVHAEEPVEPAEPSLKDALKRTAAHMEASGISAPESIGPAESAEPSWPWDVSAAEAVAEAADSATAGEERVAEQQTPAAGFSLDALEEPAADVEGGLIRGSIDDETFSAARPVILGAYGDYAADSVGEQSQAPAPEAVADEVGSADEVAPAAGDEDDLHDDISDFILDLDAMTSPEPAENAVPQATEMSAASADAPGMTCGECVYDETCPNRGQLDPARCGSFQWKP